jgi:hypothetical protein
VIGVGVGLNLHASADPSVTLSGPTVRRDPGAVGLSDKTVFTQFWVRGSGHGAVRPFRLPIAPTRPTARPAVEISAAEQDLSPGNVAPPRRIAIPTIGVDAIVDAVGLEPDGSMEIPDATNAGWYHYGTTPGQSNGSAVIAGHVDHQKAPGVFIDLPRLEVGADIVVTDALGIDRRFVVTERYQVAKDALPAPELFRLNGEPTLTLITCGGNFDRDLRHYDDNIVVRAVPQLSNSQRA